MWLMYSPHPINRAGTINFFRVLERGIFLNRGGIFTQFDVLKGGIFNRKGHDKLDVMKYGEVKWISSQIKACLNKYF